MATANGVMSPPTVKEDLLSSGTKRKRSESATPTDTETTTNAPKSDTNHCLGNQLSLDIFQVFMK